MKKNIFVIAVAAFALCMASCMKEEPVIVNPAGGNADVTAPKVKSTEDLHNTNWTYSVTYAEFIGSLMEIDPACLEGIEDETYVFGLNFDGEFAHFSFPENIVAYGGGEGELDQISGVSYTYYYDGTTHTGYLDGVVDPEDEEEPAQLQFTYNDETDAITFVLNMMYAEDGTPVTITLVFQRAE